MGKAKENNKTTVKRSEQAASPAKKAEKKAEYGASSDDSLQDQMVAEIQAARRKGQGHGWRKVWQLTDCTAARSSSEAFIALTAASDSRCNQNQFTAPAADVAAATLSGRPAGTGKSEQRQAATTKVGYRAWSKTRRTLLQFTVATLFIAGLGYSGWWIVADRELVALQTENPAIGQTHQPQLYAGEITIAQPLQRKTSLPAPELPFTTVLSQQDVATYQQIFVNQRLGAWQVADRLIAELESDILLGVVTALKYAPYSGYSAGFSEIQTWLHRYGDHPEAMQLHRLAGRNGNGAGKIFASKPNRTVKTTQRQRDNNPASTNNILFYPSRLQWLEVGIKSESTSPTLLHRAVLQSNAIENSDAKSYNYRIPITAAESGFRSQILQPALPDKFQSLRQRYFENLEAFIWSKGEFTPTYRPQDYRLSQSRPSISKTHRQLRSLLYRGRGLQALKLYQRGIKKGNFSNNEAASIRSDLIKELTLAGKWQSAYKLLGASMASTSDNNPEALWWGGLAAYLSKDFTSARSAFIRHASATTITQAQQARSWYWAGRAAQQLQQPQAALAFKQRALAAPPDTLYALLAQQEIAPQQSALDWRSLWPQLTAIDNQIALRRVLALIEVGEWQTADVHLTHLTRQTTSVPQLVALASVAELSNLPQTAFAAGQRLFHEHDLFYPRAMYPVPFWLANNQQATATIDPLLMLAIIRQESGFNYRAQSGKGARGLMQLMPRTAAFIRGYPYREHADTDAMKANLLQYEYNLDLGLKYLQYLQQADQFQGNILHMLAAYNGGQQRVKVQQQRLATQAADPLIFLETIFIKETRDYVRHVLANYLIYRQRLLVSPDLVSVDLRTGNYPDSQRARSYQQ